MSTHMQEKQVSLGTEGLRCEPKGQGIKLPCPFKFVDIFIIISVYGYQHLWIGFLSDD